MFTNHFADTSPIEEHVNKISKMMTRVNRELLEPLLLRSLLDECRAIIVEKLKPPELQGRQFLASHLVGTLSVSDEETRSMGSEAAHPLDWTDMEKMQRLVDAIKYAPELPDFRTYHEDLEALRVFGSKYHAYVDREV